MYLMSETLNMFGDNIELEKVQQRAAGWLLNDYGRFSSVTSILDQL